MDKPPGLASMVMWKLFLQKCLAERCEKSGAIVVAWLVSTVPREVTALLPSSAAVLVSSNSHYVVSRVFVCLSMCIICACVADLLRAFYPVKINK